MAERSFWRIVLTNPPTREDFLSHASLSRPVADQARVRQAEGISVFATEAQARRQAKRYPVLGQWLAELRIGRDANVEVERTDRRPGHHTMWAEPEILIQRVARLVPVEA